MSSVTVHQDIITFTAIGGAVVRSNLIFELVPVEIEGEPGVVAHKVVCSHADHEDEHIYWVSPDVYTDLINAKHQVELYQLNTLADSLG